MGKNPKDETTKIIDKVELSAWRYVRNYLLVGVMGTVLSFGAWALGAFIEEKTKDIKDSVHTLQTEMKVQNAKVDGKLESLNTKIEQLKESVDSKKVTGK